MSKYTKKQQQQQQQKHQSEQVPIGQTGTNCASK